MAVQSGALAIMSRQSVRCLKRKFLRKSPSQPVLLSCIHSQPFNSLIAFAKSLRKSGSVSYLFFAAVNASSTERQFLPSHSEASCSNRPAMQDANRKACRALVTGYWRAFDLMADSPNPNTALIARCTSRKVFPGSSFASRSDLHDGSFSGFTLPTCEAPLRLSPPRRLEAESYRCRRSVPRRSLPSG